MKRTHDDMIGEDGDERGSEDGGPELDDTSKVPPYDAKTEKLPDSPVFTPEFAQLTKSIAAIVELIATPLKETSYKDGVIEGLLQEINARTKSDFPEEVRIALIGDMKAGMSYLNSCSGLPLTTPQARAPLSTRFSARA
jgi:hypothetical protein